MLVPRKAAGPIAVSRPTNARFHLNRPIRSLLLCVLVWAATHQVVAQPLDAVRQVNSPEALGRLLARSFPQLALIPTAKVLPDEMVRLSRYESRGGSNGWYETSTRVHTSLTHRPGFTIYRSQVNSSSAAADDEIRSATFNGDGVIMLGGLVSIPMPDQTSSGSVTRIVSVNGDPRQLGPGARFEVVLEELSLVDKGREVVTRSAHSFVVNSVKDGPLPGVPIHGRIALLDASYRVIGGDYASRSRLYVSLEFGIAVRLESMDLPALSQGARSRLEDRVVGLVVSNRQFGHDRAMAAAALARRVAAMQGMLQSRGAVPPFSDLSDLDAALDASSSADLVAAVGGVTPAAQPAHPSGPQASVDRQPAAPDSKGSPGPIPPGPNRLPSTAVALRDATTECNCTRTLGRCEVASSVRDSQVTRVSNGLSSLVVVGIEPPPNQCVEATVYLRERAVIGGRARNTGHPIYRVIEGPTDVEWRNVGTPSSELTYSISQEESQCYVCEKTRPAKRASPGAAPQVPAAKFYGTILTSQWSDEPHSNVQVYIGMHRASIEEAQTRACAWLTTGNATQPEPARSLCITSNPSQSRQYAQYGVTRTHHVSQKISKCEHGGYYAFSAAYGPAGEPDAGKSAVGLACGAKTMAEARAQSLALCAEHARDLRMNRPCVLKSAALIDGTFAGLPDFNGEAGPAFVCWGSQRESDEPAIAAGLGKGCDDLARRIKATSPR